MSATADLSWSASCYECQVSHPAAARLAVLHGVRVKGFAEAAALGDFADLAEAQVSEQLDSMSAAGAVAYRQGAIAGWHLTPAGHAEHASALAAELADSGATEQVQAGYERFVALDGLVKAICTAWQVRDLDAGVVNDHTDSDYDATVVARLTTVHAGAIAVLDGLTAALPRFGPYQRRLDAAHKRVLAGDRGALTKPLSGSYHDVWMELHEDLLLTLGRQRSSTSGGG